MMKKSTVLIIIFLFVSLSAFPIMPKVNIVFLGNSITYGVQLDNRAEDAPPSVVAKYLRKKKYEVEIANCGRSGYTTVDFLPETNKQFPKVVAAADSLYNEEGAVLVFSICLGTNDSAIEGPNGSPVSPEQYEKNMKTIIDELLTRYPNSYFVLHRPTWYSPNTHNRSRYLAEGLARLQTYTARLESLTASNEERIRRGDRKAYYFFEKNWKKYLIEEKGNSGSFYLHPNKEGAQKLGEFWGKTIERELRRVR